jgi:hypothetical protein
MKALIFKNRFTVLITCLIAYVFIIVAEGLITDREPELLRFDKSLFELNILELQELAEYLE